MAADGTRAYFAADCALLFYYLPPHESVLRLYFLLMGV